LVESFELIQSRGFTGSVTTGIVLGSGLSSAIDGFKEILSIPYSDLPGFPELSVSDHVPTLAIGELNGVTVACMLGRSHFYESGDHRTMNVPIELMAMLGAQHVILTSSAASINADLVPGSLAVITDHINLNGLNPLVGRGGDGGFASMVEAYDPRYNRRCKIASGTAGITVREGIYMWFTGPSFETPAEVKMARTLGADLIGNSIVPETIICRTLGLHVTGIVAVTSYAPGFRNANPTRREAREVSRQAAISLRRLLPVFLAAKDRGT
jgi:purine-nucleoside phosphorylase